MRLWFLKYLWSTSFQVEAEFVFRIFMIYLSYLSYLVLTTQTYIFLKIFQPCFAWKVAIKILSQAMVGIMVCSYVSLYCNSKRNSYLCYQYHDKYIWKISNSSYNVGEYLLALIQLEQFYLYSIGYWSSILLISF